MGYILDKREELIDAICVCVNDRYSCDECPYKNVAKAEIPVLNIVRNTNKLSERKECVEVLLSDLKDFLLNN